MVNKPKQIGTAGETAVVRYLTANGFDNAERPAQHGALDEGDITGTPGVCWEIKAGHAAETASDTQTAAWLIEAETERVNRCADVAILVLKRKGKGAASAGQWWAVMPCWTFVQLAANDYVIRMFPDDSRPTVRVTLAEAVTLLRRAGYGTPIA